MADDMLSKKDWRENKNIEMEIVDIILSLNVYNGKIYQGKAEIVAENIIRKVRQHDKRLIEKVI